MYILEKPSCLKPGNGSTTFNMFKEEQTVDYVINLDRNTHAIKKSMKN